MAEELAKKRQRGAKTKLTPEIIAEFVRVLRATSTPITYIAEAAGISKATLFVWLDKGERRGSGIYRDFADAVRRARAEGTQATLAQMRKIGIDQKDWRQMAWELERTRPKEFGLRVRVHVEEELKLMYERMKGAFAGEPAILERIIRVIAGEAFEEARAEEVQPPTVEQESSE